MRRLMFDESVSMVLSSHYWTGELSRKLAFPRENSYVIIYMSARLRG